MTKSLTRPPLRSLPTRPTINGIPGDIGDEEFSVYDPGTEQEIARIPDVGVRGIDEAVSSARGAMDGWAHLAPRDRAAGLLRLADLIEEHSDELAVLESLDVGKPITLSPAEIASSADKLRFFAGAARQQSGLAANEYRPPLTSFTRREPVGVVGALTPWNYPLALAVWKLGPALAAGNTLVLKPSPDTPLSTLRLGELAAEVLPAGVVNVVTGGTPAGRRLVDHEDVAMISLTGGTETGKAIIRASANTVKRLHLELGGNASMLVFPDADLDKLREVYFMAAFRNTGQDCHAASRVYAHRDIVDDVIRVISDVAQSTPMGDQFDTRTLAGPLVSTAQHQRITSLVQEATSSADVVVEAGGLDRAHGNYFPLTVLSGVKHEDRIAQEEIFGPVVTVSTFTDEDTAVAYANGVPQGLAASVWTENVDRIMRVSHRLNVGTVWVNTHGQTVAEMPFGGTKESGYGNDLSVYAMEQHSMLKHIAIHVAPG